MRASRWTFNSKEFVLAKIRDYKKWKQALVNEKK
jgi:hypothetical protein